MYRRVRDNFMNSVNGRMLVFFIAVIAVGMILIYRIFSLQIVNGAEALSDFTLRIQKERTINSSRGKIFDRNGKLLAYNELAYNVTIEDVYESGNGKNAALNDTLSKVIQVIEKNGDKIINDFNIIINEDGEYEFTVSDTKLKRFLADIYGIASPADLKYEMETATADEVMQYLMGYSKYGVGESTDPDNLKKSFVIGKGYSKQQCLKLVTIRYAMSLNNYQKYIPTTIATDVNEKTVANIMENSEDYLGVSISEDNIRKYVDSVYFSQILGYTGKISEDELYTLNNQKVTEENEKTVKERDDYVLTDMIGKAGIEQTMETYLQGIKGYENLYVNNLGRVIESKNEVAPVAGNDLYLTIDHDLQIATYNILEQKLAGILVNRLINVKEYNPPENLAASKRQIPIGDVYYALFNNSIVDINRFDDEDAKENESSVLDAFNTKKASVFERLGTELSDTRTPYKDDATYLAWRKDETISLGEYLEYCISNRWIDVTKINLQSEYSDSQEVYAQLVDYIIESLDNNTVFSKKMYKYMIKDDMISGRQICSLLLEQDVISITEDERQKFENGQISPYNFMIYLIQNLFITPAQLALDPYAASVVITNTEGEVLALVSYPGYDNNRLANSIDSDYYAKLQSDLSKPLWNYATQQRTAPGSTFKMVSATAALSEGIVDTSTTITCKGYFDRFANELYKCWIYPSAHGSLNVTGGIANSCNAFFYEVGYRLSLKNDTYDSDTGIAKLAKYADMYGLSEKSGIEIEESAPEVSTEYPVLSAIGQGTNNYTTIGLARYVTTVANSGTCYNLTLLDQVTDSNGNMIKDYAPAVRNTVEMPTAYWNAIHSGMRQVVEKKPDYNNLGVNVAGKTGTAEESANRTNHALFISYAPYENPEITVSTRIAYGYTSAYAANLTRDIYKYYFKLEDEDSILTGTAATPDVGVITAD